MYILETKGTKSNEVREFKTFEEASGVMEKEYESYDKVGFSIAELEDDCAELGCCESEMYQSWIIYEKKDLTGVDLLFHEIKRELERANVGTTQFSYELVDTSTITNHLWRLEQLVEQLEEVVGKQEK